MLQDLTAGQVWPVIRSVVAQLHGIPSPIANASDLLHPPSVGRPDTRMFAGDLHPPEMEAIRSAHDAAARLFYDRVSGRSAIIALGPEIGPYFVEQPALLDHLMLGLALGRMVQQGLIARPAAHALLCLCPPDSTAARCFVDDWAIPRRTLARCATRLAFVRGMDQPCARSCASVAGAAAGDLSDADEEARAQSLGWVRNCSEACSAGMCSGSDAAAWLAGISARFATDQMRNVAGVRLSVSDGTMTASSARAIVGQWAATVARLMFHTLHLGSVVSLKRAEVRVCASSDMSLANALQWCRAAVNAKGPCCEPVGYLLEEASYRRNASFAGMCPPFEYSEEHQAHLVVLPARSVHVPLPRSWPHGLLLLSESLAPIGPLTDSVELLSMLYARR